MKRSGAVVERHVVDMAEVARETGVALAAARADSQVIEGGEDVTIGERLQVVPLHACSCVTCSTSRSASAGGRVEREIVIAARGRMR